MTLQGTSRGIGLALTERLAKENRSNVIYAGARTPESAKALQALVEKYSGQIKIVQLDPTDQASVDVRCERSGRRVAYDRPPSSALRTHRVLWMC